jgi:hypothetical protein
VLAFQIGRDNLVGDLAQPFFQAQVGRHDALPSG